jgi:hypothetical protein
LLEVIEAKLLAPDLTSNNACVLVQDDHTPRPQPQPQPAPSRVFLGSVAASSVNQPLVVDCHFSGVIVMLRIGV